MCLAVPMRIEEINGTRAKCDSGGNLIEVELSFAPEAKVGDYVIVHAGFAIKVMDAEEANETIALINDVLEKQDTAGNI